MENEGRGTAVTVTITPTGVSSPPCGPDLLSLGSLSDTVCQLEPPPSDDVHSSSGNLRDKIIKQVEYYFSDENLPTDKYMLNFIKKEKEGFVPIEVLASFRKMKRLVHDTSLIVAALRESTMLVVSSDGKKVKRLHPFIFADVKDPKLCTVLVENLPEDHSTENIERIFGKVGKVENIRICDPHSVEKSTRGGKEEKLISNKVHALVEYDTVEAAEKAVATLNDEQDWRNGMRVKLLNRIGTYRRTKGRKDHDFDKNGSLQAADVGERSLSDETPDEADGGHLKEKHGQKGQQRGGSRRQKYRGNNGHGHGTISSSHGGEASKPLPGPRMPDGSRGFTMGRGRTPMSKQS